MLRGFIMAVVALIASPLAAAQLAYICTLDVPQSEAWVPAQVIVLSEEGSDEALVNDPIISHFLKTPQKARIVADTAKRITFVWTLPKISNGARQFTSNFEYRLSVLKSSKQASIVAKPLGYSNNFTAQGTCRIAPAA